MTAAYDDQLSSLENQAAELTTQVAEQQEKQQVLTQENGTLMDHRDELKVSITDKLTDIEAMKKLQLEVS